MFEREIGTKLSLVFGSTGLLSKQAENGAPFDLLFAANESFIRDLEQKGRVVSGSRTLYAVGRLVICTRKGIPPPKSIHDLADGRFRRIAVANPDHAPYGVAARQALQKAGVWDAVSRRIVFGENVQQTLQYARTGNADAAIVALSVAIGSDVPHTTVPEKLHPPILQAAGVLSQSKDPALARRFVDFVRSPRGQKVMVRYGFTLPRRRR